MTSERFSYALTEIAEEDVEEAFDYITNELHNPEAASSFADELDEKLEEICRTPKSGRPVHNPYLKRDGIRRVLVKNYIAYYLIDETEAKIVVLRVVYNRRNQDEILKSV
ncbi:MAG: type II toxin-antitoxin system RelE/ParE family toxin [Blautia sp.]|nr:type II toxin-antitoxin system RelE/ParE family toxin [Blautia sp.]